MEAGDTAGAEEILLSAAEAAPSDSRVRKELGIMGRPAAALEALLAIAPNHAAASQALEAMGR